MPYLTMPHHARPRPAMSCRTLPYHTEPRRTFAAPCLARPNLT